MTEDGSGEVRQDSGEASCGGCEMCASDQETGQRHPTATVSDMQQNAVGRELQECEHNEWVRDLVQRPTGIPRARADHNDATSCNQVAAICQMGLWPGDV